MASREARGSNIRASESGRRVTTNHSSGPVRLRSIRVCTRHLTISMATGPFSPSRTVNRLQAVGSNDVRHSVTDCQGDLGRRPRPEYAGNGASRSRIVVVQGTPSTERSPRSRSSWRNRVWRPSSSSPVTQPWGTCAGSDVHVMLALRRRSRQVVVTNEKFNGPDVIRELLGKG